MYKKFLKIILLLVFLALLTFAGIIIYLSNLEPNEFKSDIESFFSKYTGLKLEIIGDLEVNMDDDVFVQIGAINVYDSLGILIEMDSMNASMPFSIPRDSLTLNFVEFFNPVYHFRSQGIIAFKTAVSSSNSFLSPTKIKLDSFSIHNGHLVLTGTDNVIVNAKGVSTKNGRLTLDLSKKVLEGLHIQASCLINETDVLFINPKMMITEFEMKLGVLTFQNSLKNEQNTSVEFTLDLNPELILYQFEGAYEHVPIKTLYESWQPDYDFVKGYYSAKYNFRFTIPDTFNLAYVSGDFKFSSSDATIMGVELDKMIRSFKRTQNFSLKDLGSVVLLGPWGLALSKGGDYAQLAASVNNDSSEIERVYCHVTIDSGIVDFQDVAFRTTKNRIALSGRIDAVNNIYRRFSYAIIDDEGCPEIREEFNGSFKQDDSNGMDNVKVLFGPVTNLFKGSSKIIKNEGCSNSYNGTVEAPSKKSGLFHLNKDSKKEKESKKKNRKKN